MVANKVNISNTQWAINACLPDWGNKIGLTMSETETSFIAPCAGWICLSALANGLVSFTVNNNEIAKMKSPAPKSYNMDVHAQILVNKNDIIKFKTSLADSSTSLGVFIPCKGAINE